jgi:hypothetical protein
MYCVLESHFSKVLFFNFVCTDLKQTASHFRIIVPEKATNPRNHITDTAAVVEMCSVLNKEPYCAHIATRVIASKIQSSQEWEALQALNVSTYMPAAIRRWPLPS